MHENSIFLKGCILNINLALSKVFNLKSYGYGSLLRLKMKKKRAPKSICQKVRKCGCSLQKLAVYLAILENSHVLDPKSAFSMSRGQIVVLLGHFYT